ncbi:MAG: TolC family protein [Nitrospira sp.]|nr:TolC family protein [Nitrospira sp.]
MRYRSFWIFLFGILLTLMQNNAALAQGPKQLSLNDAVTLAMEQNPQIRLAKQGVAASEGLALQARAIPRPELSATWTGIPSGLEFGQAEEREIGMSQAFEFPGKRRIRGRVGDLGVELTQAQLERLKALVAARVKQFYYAALAPQTEIENLESVRDLLSGFVESTLTKYQGGEIPFVEVLRFKVELARLNNDLIEARRRLAVRLRELNLLLGLPPDTSLSLTNRLGFSPFFRTLEDIQTEAFGSSQVLRIAQVATRQSDQSLQLARMGYSPDFRIGAFAFDTPGAGNDGWTAEIGLEVPLWGWWEQKGKIQEAKARQENRLIQQEVLERAIRGSVASAFERVKAAEAQAKIFQTSLLADTGDALQSAITEYQFNRINALSLLDIYRTYKTTQIEYTRALLNYQIVLEDLEVAAELPTFPEDQKDESVIQALLPEER